VGYSFGAFVLLHAARDLPDLERAYIFSPALTYGPAMPVSGFREEGFEFLEYVRLSRPHTYRLGSVSTWKRFYEGQLNEPSGRLSKLPITVESFYGQQDGSFDGAILNCNHDAIIRKFLPAAASINLTEVPGGSHGIDTLAEAFRCSISLGDWAAC
jgi:pimeloyl-ACP methyl ester carboxylesterase